MLSPCREVPASMPQALWVWPAMESPLSFSTEHMRHCCRLPAPCINWMSRKTVIILQVTGNVYVFSPHVYDSPSGSMGAEVTGHHGAELDLEHC